MIEENPRGSNRHPKIDAWLKDIGSPLGSAWCMAAAYGVNEEAGEPWPWTKSGRVQTVVDSGTLLPASEAKPGDLIVFWFKNLNRYAHVAICEARVKNHIITLDFNSIPDGAAGDSREGWGVWRKKRTISDRVKVLR